MKCPWEFQCALFLLLASLSRGHPHLFCRYYIPHLCHQVILAAHTVFQMVECHHSHSQLLFFFFYNSIYAWFKSTYSIISLPHFYLCWAILSQLSTFVKCHMDLSLGDKNTRQLHALLSVPERNHRCTVTNYQQPLKEVTWSVTDQDVYLLFMWWFINWRASSKVCTVYNYSQIIYCGNWIWTMLLRDNII